MGLQVNSDNVDLRSTMRFTNKVAIVTGAGCVAQGWGNGRAITVGLAKEGAKVFAVDRDLERVQETISLAGAAATSITPWACDVTKSDDIANMVAQCMKMYGAIDVLVNNVGGSAPGGPIEMSEDVWDLQIDTNLKSVFLTCKHVLPVMVAQQRGPS
jgi:NAD(P)-dependent dehydrogenase (short-subunit alcohol dehydrogenase family)